MVSARLGVGRQGCLDGIGQEFVMRERNYVFKRCSCRDRRDGRGLGVRCPRLREEGHGSWYFSLESRDAAEQARGYLLGEDVDPDRAAVTTGQWLDLWLETRSIGFHAPDLPPAHP